MPHLRFDLGCWLDSTNEMATVNIFQLSQFLVAEKISFKHV